jgi:uncharacterized protein YecE (DUF72 family)
MGTLRDVLYVGTSGWQYRDWRDAFYPPKLRAADWLAAYASQFGVVEVNSTFYGLPKTSSVERWVEETPAGFVFVTKMSRYLTHVRRLRDPEQPVRLFFERLEALGPRLGPVLLQFPPTLVADVGLLDEALRLMPRRVRIAVEPRHPSWFTDEVRRLLAKHDAALCVADRHNRLQGPVWRTASWAYVRLHEGVATPRPCYGDEALRHWVSRIASTWGGDDVYVFFNNDHRACAPHNAIRLRELAQRAGLQVAGGQVSS